MTPRMSENRDSFVVSLKLNTTDNGSSRRRGIGP